MDLDHLIDTDPPEPGDETRAAVARRASSIRARRRRIGAGLTVGVCALLLAGVALASPDEDDDGQPVASVSDPTVDEDEGEDEPERPTTTDGVETSDPATVDTATTLPSGVTATTGTVAPTTTVPPAD